MAILLQNQEFVRQLQSNRDFIRTLNQDIQNQEMERSAGGLVPDDGVCSFRRDACPPLPTLLSPVLSNFAQHVSMAV
ncbi:hypothetical protein V5799_014982 [Amblyomma americanum]|uniref:Uncharacterized protein n=1 Tax=Amblyomma americanum TaxID=6943 RepID=A0AAQ4E1G4_AMBAM